HQLRAIRRAQELGLHVAAIDRNADAPGLAVADEADVVDFGHVADAVAAARRIAPDGGLTIASDRAVPVVAAVADALGLPAIGRETARVGTNKLAMRRRLEEAGVPQPRYTAIRGPDDVNAALDEIGPPAVVKPVDCAGQRGLSLVRETEDMDAAVAEALGHSRAGEAIVERLHEGIA